MIRRGYEQPPWAHHAFRELNEKLDKLLRIGEKMAVDQATFDTDLAALVTAIGTLTQSVDAWIASHPAADLIALLEEAEAVPVKRGSYAKTRAVKRQAELSD